MEKTEEKDELVKNEDNYEWGAFADIVSEGCCVFCVLQGFFPGLITVAYVLRPAGFLQKAISEVSNKIFRDEFKFRVSAAVS